MPITTPAPRPPRVRHPVLVGWPPGIFCPAAVGRVRGYPRTPETYARQLERLRANHKTALDAGKLHRLGVPNGWAGRRDQVAELRQEATNEGWQVLNALHRNSLHADERLDPDNLAELQAGTRAPMTDPERFAIAAAFALGVIRDPTMTTKFRLQAARMILPFLAQMPRAARAGLGESLAWLDGLAGREGG